MTPSVILVMGPAGCGKSTLATALAAELPFVVVDADGIHSAANVERMRRGIALDDRARQPWLRRVRGAIDDRRAEGARVVVACSALKASYRDLLLGGIPDAVVVYLKADRPTLERRLHARPGHFMPAGLLASQLADLEEPERAIVLDAGLPPAAQVEHLRRLLDEGD